MKNYWKAFGYAFAGIRRFFQIEFNSKIHLIATLLVVSCGFYFRLDGREWLWLLAAIALVFLTEMFNSSIELLCNKLTTEKDKDIETIKDISAGAVLISALLSILVAAIIFYPYLFK